MTHPDPLPPTMAIFFPAGTQNVIPCRIVCPGTYSKYTSSKVMVDVGGSTCSTGAPTSLWHHRHKLNLCDDTCVTAISIQRHDPEHAQAEFMWWHMCYGYQHSASLSWTRTSWIHVMTLVLRLSAFNVSFLSTHKLNSCDDTCVKAISIQRHRHEHTHGNMSWMQHANGASRSKDTRHWWIHAGMHAHRHVCEYTYKHACVYIYMSYGHICVNTNTSVHAYTCTHT